MTIVALLTGKSHSTLPDKNLLPVLGRPLLWYPATAARRSKYISRFYASSDSARILDAAGELGYERIVRPPELARPDSQHRDTILHALEVLESRGVRPDLLVVLLANSATLKTEWIDRSIEIVLGDAEVSAVVPAHEVLDHHPYRAKRLGVRGFLEPYVDLPANVSTNRQDLEASYFLDHSFWVLHVERGVRTPHGQPPWDFMGRRIRPFLTDDAIDVHCREDLTLTEEWLRRNGMAPAAEGLDALDATRPGGVERARRLAARCGPGAAALPPPAVRARPNLS